MEPISNFCIVIILFLYTVVSVKYNSIPRVKRGLGKHIRVQLYIFLRNTKTNLKLKIIKKHHIHICTPNYLLFNFTIQRIQ